MTSKLTYKNEQWSDIITLLNQPAIDFFQNKIEFDDPDYPMFIKSTLLSAMNDIERTIKGRFGYELLDLEPKDQNALKEMFPAGYKILGFGKIKWMLNQIRNINAHAVLSVDDVRLLESKTFFSDLSRISRLNMDRRIRLTISSQGGLVSLGGLIALISLFLRETSLKTLCKSTRLFLPIISKEYETFIKTVSYVNLELPIRQVEGEDILSAILGEYANQTEKEGELLSIHMGDKNYPTTYLDFQFDEKKKILKVNKGSISKAYYKENYELLIKDVKQFIGLANQFPPFVFVDLLYSLGIIVFDKKAAKKVMDNFDRYSKLNYSKFYTNKNIAILLLPETIADLQVVSSALSNGLSSLFLTFENRVLNNYSFRKDDYSELSDALKLIGLSEKLATKLQVIRNCCFHGQILNEWVCYAGKYFCFSFEFVIETLRELLTELKNKNYDMYAQLSEDIERFIVHRMIRLKYNVVVECSLEVFSGQTGSSSKISENRFLYPQRSCFDTTILNKLYLDEPSLLLIECYIEKENRYYYVFNEDEQKTYLYSYINENFNRNKITITDCGIVERLFVSKKRK